MSWHICVFVKQEICQNLNDKHKTRWNQNDRKRVYNRIKGMMLGMWQNTVYAEKVIESRNDVSSHDEG